MADSKRMLVTAGSTVVHIDRVRVIRNIFRGRTGEEIALEAAAAGWQVTLLTSKPKITPTAAAPKDEADDSRRLNLATIRYRTFDDLAELMKCEVISGRYDAIVHSAAVSDFRPSLVSATDKYGHPSCVKAGAESINKLPSSLAQVTIHLEPTPKLVDQIRQPWGFSGKLVKFKLQVDWPDQMLIDVARRSRITSKADLIVANDLNWCDKYAYIIGDDEVPCRVTRQELPSTLLRRLS